LSDVIVGTDRLLVRALDDALPVSMSALLFLGMQLEQAALDSGGTTQPP
jgi:hypothetical protein